MSIIREERYPQNGRRGHVAIENSDETTNTTEHALVSEWTGAIYGSWDWIREGSWDPHIVVEAVNE